MSLDFTFTGKEDHGRPADDDEPPVLGSTTGIKGRSRYGPHAPEKVEKKKD